MKVGDRVRKDLVIKVEDAQGVIIKINKEYVVVVWDEVNGDWHYTKEQTKKLEVLNETR